MSITLREAAEEAWMWLVSEWADDFEARHVAASYKAEAIEHLRLALDADPEGPLDVERLAQAMAAAEGGFVGKHSLWTSKAERAAAEYERLAREQANSEPPE